MVEGISELDTAELVRDGALVAATVIVTRIVWVFPFTYLPRRLWQRACAGSDPFRPGATP